METSWHSFSLPSSAFMSAMWATELKSERLQSWEFTLPQNIKLKTSLLGCVKPNPLPLILLWSDSPIPLATSKHLLIAWHKLLHVIHIPHLGGKPLSRTSFSRGSMDLQSLERPRSDLRKPELTSTSVISKAQQRPSRTAYWILFYHLMLLLIHLTL